MSSTSFISAVSSQEDLTLVNLHVQVNKPIVDSPLLMSTYLNYLSQVTNTFSQVINLMLISFDNVNSIFFRLVVLIGIKRLYLQDPMYLPFHSSKNQMTADWLLSVIWQNSNLLLGKFNFSVVFLNVNDDVFCQAVNIYLDSTC